MLNRFFVFLQLLISLLPGFCAGQVCPGGGSSLSSSVTFDPAWIYGCNTGTSCNGGVAFDNRNACEPITSMDACAPAPGCGVPGNSGSDIWFRFFANSPTALISCFQNTSLVLGIQAFSGSGTCGSLVTIGCALSAGPSSGVKLPLSGLLPGVQYYFRIFGSANPPSQRTGLYCFCGSSGLGNFLILPVLVNQFSAKAINKAVVLSWHATTQDGKHRFVVERSPDAIHFSEIGSAHSASGGIDRPYAFIDNPPGDGTFYYRIKNEYADGHYDYSDFVSAKYVSTETISIAGNTVRDVLVIKAATNVKIDLLDISGRRLKEYIIVPGTNRIAVNRLPTGPYLLRSLSDGKIQRFYVLR